MAINLYDGTNHDGLFDILGKAFYAASVLNTARGTTVPDEFVDFIEQYKTKADATLAMDSGLSAVSQSVQSFQRSASSTIATLRTFCANLIIEVVNEDAVQPVRTLAQAMGYLIADMLDQGAYVESNGNTTTPYAGSGNSDTDLFISVSGIGSDGEIIENVITENIDVTVTSTDRRNASILRFRSPSAVDRLDWRWPTGSGIDVSFTATDPADSLLTNGDFEDESETVPDLPDGWIIGVGTPGTHFELTAVEVQTIAISGTPTSGHFFLKWQTPDSVTYSTPAIAWNATAADIQDALNTIPGLESVTVEQTSGSAPNYTYTVTFTGTNGNINQLTSLEQFDTGSVSHATTVAGSAHSFKGRALKFTSDGSTLPSLYLPLEQLSLETLYALQFRHRISANANGVVRVAIVDGIGGSPVELGVENSWSSSESYNLNVDFPAATWVDKCIFVALKKEQIQPLYLEIKVTNAIDSGVIYSIDEMSLAPASQLYPGGPFVAIQAGTKGAYASDTWTLSVESPRTALLQNWFDAFFDMPRLGLRLPTSGSTSIPDSVVG